MKNQRRGKLTPLWSPAEDGTSLHTSLCITCQKYQKNLILTQEMKKIGVNDEGMENGAYFV